MQDNSIRFRLTIKETELLEREKRLDRRTEILGSGGSINVFAYSISVDERISDSEIRLGPASIEFVLCPTDARCLFDPTREGVYVRREIAEPDGGARRFLAFVEKDRPGSTCIKPEEWIYDVEGGRPVRTVPIPKSE
jgi:hypothetical protein